MLAHSSLGLGDNEYNSQNKLMTTNDALHTLFLSARKSMARVVSRIVPPREIEDIVQESYVRICQIENKETIKQPRSFLLKTARNLAIDHIKRAESQLVDAVEETSELLHPQYDKDVTYERAVCDEEFGQFCEAVRQLPVQCRKVFVLKKVYGYSQKEIAKQLELSESTVEKHIALGIKRCTQIMMNMSQQPNKQTKNQASPSRGGFGHD